MADRGHVVIGARDRLAAFVCGRVANRFEPDCRGPKFEPRFQVRTSARSTIFIAVVEAIVDVAVDWTGGPVD